MGKNYWKQFFGFWACYGTFELVLYNCDSLLPLDCYFIRIKAQTATFCASKAACFILTLFYFHQQHPNVISQIQKPKINFNLSLTASASSRPPCRIYCPYPFVADYNRCQCRCNPSIICPSGCSPDPNTCICPQPSCPPHFIKDPLTNKCVCDQSYQYGCAYNQKWDNQTCHCACGKSEICKTGFYFDTIYCGCKCVQKTCEKNFIQNLNTCECVCDSSRVNKSCPSGYVFSYVTCQCEVVPNASC